MPILWSFGTRGSKWYNLTMPMRKIQFLNDDYYHIYNRGVEKRKIVSDDNDQHRFLRSLNIFNTTESVGSVLDYEIQEKRNPGFHSGAHLVEITAFNLLDNHYHLVLKQLVDKGISKFMQSLSGGFTKYFNCKYDRVGPLFQGPFKASFLYDYKLEKAIAYVNLNHVIHKFGTPGSKWGMCSSWGQYVNKEAGIVKISKWGKFNKNKSIAIVNEIIKDRNIDLEPGVPNEDEGLLY